MKFQKQFEDWYKNKYTYYESEFRIDDSDEVCGYLHDNIQQAYEIWLEFNDWLPMDQAPKDGSPFLVMLEQHEPTDDKFHIAQLHNNCNIIGHHFSYDCNKPIGFRYIHGMIVDENT